MEKLFNLISVTFALAGGIFIKLFGGFDMLIKAMFILVMLDYITGIIKAAYLKSLSSYIGFKGILKKVTIFIVIALSVVIQRLIGATIALREIVIMFFICNEALSLLENAAVLVPVPDTLKDILLQLREKTSEREDE